MLEAGPQVHRDDDPAALADPFQAEIGAHARPRLQQSGLDQRRRDLGVGRAEPVRQHVVAEVDDLGAEHVEPVLGPEPFESGEVAQLPCQVRVEVDGVEGDQGLLAAAGSVGRAADVDRLPDRLLDPVPAADEGVLPLRALRVRHHVGPPQPAQPLFGPVGHLGGEILGAGGGVARIEGGGAGAGLGPVHQVPGAAEHGQQDDNGRLRRPCRTGGQASDHGEHREPPHRAEPGQSAVAEVRPRGRQARVAGERQQVHAQRQAGRGEAVPGQLLVGVAGERVVQVDRRAEQSGGRILVVCRQIGHMPHPRPPFRCPGAGAPSKSSTQQARASPGTLLGPAPDAA